MSAKRRCRSEHAARLYKSPRRASENQEDNDENERLSPAERMLGNRHILNTPPQLCDVGPMSADEAEIIRQALTAFKHEYNLDIEELVVLIQASSYERDGSNSYRDDTQRVQAKTLWSAVYSDFEGRRSQRNVRDWVRRHYTTGRRLGGWTNEEDQRLIDAYQETPAQWTQIAAVVGARTADDCWARWRDHLQYREQKTTSRWSEEEELRLRKAVAQVQEENATIHWPRVSELMNHTRSRIQCLQKYQRLLARDNDEEGFTPRRRPRRSGTTKTPSASSKKSTLNSKNASTLKISASQTAAGPKKQTATSKTPSAPKLSASQQPMIKQSSSQLPDVFSPSPSGTHEPSGRLKLSPTPSVVGQTETTFEETPFSLTPPPAFPDDPKHIQAATILILSLLVMLLDDEYRVDFDKDISDVDWEFLRWLLTNISLDIEELAEEPRAMWERAVEAVGGEQEWFADTVVTALNYMISKSHAIEDCYPLPSYNPEVNWTDYGDVAKFREEYNKKEKVWLAAQMSRN